MTSNPLIHFKFEDDLLIYISAFLDDLLIAKRSEQTIRFYRGNLERFDWWCREHEAPRSVERITSLHLRQFFRYLNEPDRWGITDHTPSTNEVSDSTHDAYYRSLRAFFNWLVDQEFIASSPLAKVPKPKVAREQPDPFTNEEISAIVRALGGENNPFLAARNRAMLAVMLDTGLRVSELCAINLSKISMP